MHDRASAKALLVAHQALIQRAVALVGDAEVEPLLGKTSVSR